MKTKGMVPVFPNLFPYNELLLSGKLLAKTRDWSWDYRGPVLLYTSSRNESRVWEAYGMRPRDYPHKMIVGRGNLVDCRPLSEAEKATLIRQFNPTATENTRDSHYWFLIRPMYFGFFFEDLVRFAEPVAIDWPAGAVKPISLPLSAVAGLLASPPDPTIKSLSYAATRVVKPKRKEVWAELTDEKIAALNHMGRYKIRLSNGWEVSTTWDHNEGCFYWNYGEDAAYVDESSHRPTHIRVGFES